MRVAAGAQRSHGPVRAFALVSTLAWLFGASPAFADEPPMLVSPVPHAARAALAKAGGPDGVRRQRPVSANVAFMAANAAGGGAATRLELFDGAVVTLDTDRVDWRALDNYAWFGKVRGNPDSEVVLTVVNGYLTGHVSLAADDGSRALYRIESDGDATHWLEELDPDAFPADHPAGNELLYAPEEKAKPVAGKADSGAVIDLMVVYGAKTATAAGSAITSQIQAAVDRANLAYANSGISTKLRLVYSGAVSYAESGDFNTDLNRLTTTTDGYLDEVHALRNTYGADLVSLFVENTQYCGLGWIGPSATKAFTVVNRGCAGSNYSLAHEIGHNFGARHDAYVDGSSTPYAYGHGEVSVAGRWRTVMAYNDECAASGVSCTRIAYFSTPAKTYNGAPLGLSTSADNARVHNQNVVAVANFRASGGSTTTTTPCSWTLSPSSASVAAAGGTGSTTVTSAAGCAWNAASNAAWLSIASATATGGSGTLAFSAAANAGAARSGTISIGTTTLTVTQASGCTFTVSPASLSTGAAATTGTLAVTGSAGCGWSASSAASWVTITGGASGNGSGTVSYAIAGNTGTARTGNLTVAGSTVTVTQSGATTPTADAALSLSTSTLNYGNVNVGRKGKTLSARLTNVGSTAATLGTLSMSGASGDFAGSGTCRTNLTLAAGASCTLQYTFYPSVAGTRTATVSAATAARSYALTLTGIAKPNGK